MAEKEFLITEEFRASFVHLFQPKPTQQGDRYTVTMLFPKNQSQALIGIRDLCHRAAAAKYGMGQGGPNVPNNFTWPWKDGDTWRDKQGNLKTDKYPEMAGCWVLEAKSMFQPGLVDYQRQPIIAAEQFYSGCYARAQIDAYEYDNQGNVGVCLGLNNVQKTRDGERLSGGGMAAQDAFGEFQGGSNNVAPQGGQNNFGGQNNGGQFNNQNSGGQDNFGGNGGQNNPGNYGQNDPFNGGGNGQNYNNGGGQFNNQNNMNGNGQNNNYNNGGGQYNNQNNNNGGQYNNGGGQFNNQNNMNGGQQSQPSFP